MLQFPFLAIISTYYLSYNGRLWRYRTKGPVCPGGIFYEADRNRSSAENPVFAAYERVARGVLMFFVVKITALRTTAKMRQMNDKQAKTESTALIGPVQKFATNNTTLLRYSVKR